MAGAEDSLFPCADVKGNSVGGEIDTNVMFFAGFVGVPSEERSAGLFVELVFLMRGPVRRHKDLQPGNQIAKAGFAGGSGDFLPIAHEFCAGIARGGNFLDQTIFRAGEFVGSKAGEIGGASLESFFESLAKFVTAGRSTKADAGRSGLRRLGGSVVHEIGRVKRIDDEVDLRGVVGLFGNFEVQRTLTDVRAFGGSGFAIGSAGVDIAVVAGRFDVEVPGRAEEFERVHGARIPVAGIGEWNLSVADQHGDVVGPGGRGAGNFCGFGG